MSKPQSAADVAKCMFPKKIAVSALALSLAGMGLMPGLSCAIASEATDAPVQQAVQAETGPQQAAGQTEDTASDGSPESQTVAADPNAVSLTGEESLAALIASAQVATSGETLRDVTSRVVGATMDRDLYGAVENPMSLEYHDRTVSFVDIDGGKTTGRISLGDEQSLYMAAVSSQIDDWAALAYNIFGYADTSNSKLYTDHAGNGFDRDFGPGGNYVDLYSALMTADGDGSTGKDCWRSSGLSYASSLAGAYNALTDTFAASLGGSHKTTGADVRGHLPIDALSSNTDNQTVIYSNVIQVDRAGSTPKYYVNGFGIAFYDFEVHPLSNDKVLNMAPEGSSGYEYQSKTDKKSFVTQSTNQGYDDASVDVSLTKTSSETVSNSTSASSSVSFGQQIGISGSYERKFGLADKNTAAISVSADISFEEAYSTAYSTESSITDSIDESVTVSTTLPAHTVACTEQTSSDATLVQSYDEPVGITFKVAIYSLNSECYQDSGGVASFSTAGYDQYTFCTLFGGGDSLTTDAQDALYMRAVEHVGEPSYEQAFGAVSTYGRYGHDKLISAIDWSSVLADHSNGSANMSGHLSDIVSTYPMSIDGATITIHAQSVDTVLMTAQPLYPIASIKVKWQFDRDKDMQVGDEMAISSTNVSRVSALDKDAVDYYGFVASSGEWKIVDAEGNEATSDVIDLVTDSVTHEQTVVAKAPGTAYVKYFIPENTYVDAYGNVSTNADIDSAAYKITVADPAFQGSIALSGAPQVTVGVADNLNTMAGVDVAAYDTTGKEVEATVQWEAQELASRGIELSADGTVLATQPGTFHVRAFIDGVFSDWIELVAVEAAAEPEVPADEGAPVEPEAPEEPQAPADEAAPAEDVTPAESEAPADEGAQAAPEVPAEEAVPAADEAAPAEEGVPAEEGAPVEDAGLTQDGTEAPVLETTLGELADGVYQYGVTQGLISGNPEDGFSQQDYYTMGVLYCAASHMGMIPAETQAALDAYLDEHYGADQVQAWREQALTVLRDAGYIDAEGDAAEEAAPAEEAPVEETPADPVPEEAEPAEEAPAEEVAPVEEAPVEEPAPAPEELSGSPFVGVWSYAAPDHTYELVIDRQSPAAFIVWDRQDGLMGTWGEAGDGSATVTLGSATCTLSLDGDSLWVDYNGTPVQFVRSAW